MIPVVAAGNWRSGSCHWASARSDSALLLSLRQLSSTWLDRLAMAARVSVLLRSASLSRQLLAP